MDKDIKHTYGQNSSGQNGKAGNPSVTQNPSNDGTISKKDDKTSKDTDADNEIQENKSSKEQKNRVRK